MTKFFVCTLKAAVKNIAILIVSEQLVVSVKFSKKNKDNGFKNKHLHLQLCMIKKIE